MHMPAINFFHKLPIDHHEMCHTQARHMLLVSSRFKSLDALLKIFEDFDGGTGVLYLRAEPSKEADKDLVPCEVDGVRDIQDMETGKTLRAYLGQTHLFHKAFR